MIERSESGIIYFDHNATYPIFPSVAESIADLQGLPLNPSSLHKYGRDAKRLMEEARQKVSSLANATKYNLIFTGSGTEANNLALRGVNLPVITTLGEHASVLQPVGKGIVAVKKDGIVDFELLEHILKALGKKLLVSVILANNETGVIQPITEIAELVHRYGCLLHTDASQAFGKIPLDLDVLGADLITVTSHKFGGPVGAAGLFVRKGLEIEPLLIGGGQERGMRSGTPNIVAIHGFGMASEIVAHTLSSYKEVEKLRNYIEARLLQISSGSVVFGKGSNRLPNTSSITMPFVKNETQVIHFDLNNIALSAGSACSSGRMDYPHVQLAMGYDSALAVTAIRISLGLGNTEAEADQFIKAWSELYYKNNKKAI